MLSKTFRFTREITFPKIAEDGTDAKFALVFRTITDEELGESLNSMGIGATVEDVAKQRAFNEQVLVSASCPEHFPGDDAAALAWIVDAPMAIRAAVRLSYVNAIYSGDLAQKN